MIMSESMDIDELRKKSKEAGIDSWHVKSKARLMSELSEIYKESEETEATTALPKPINPRAQMQRGQARIGVMREQVYEHIYEGWIEIDAE